MTFRDLRQETLPPSHTPILLSTNYQVQGPCHQFASFSLCLCSRIPKKNAGRPDCFFFFFNRPTAAPSGALAVPPGVFFSSSAERPEQLRVQEPGLEAPEAPRDIASAVAQTWARDRRGVLTRKGRRQEAKSMGAKRLKHLTVPAFDRRHRHSWQNCDLSAALRNSMLPEWLVADQVAQPKGNTTYVASLPSHLPGRVTQDLLSKKTAVSKFALEARFHMKNKFSRQGLLRRPWTAVLIRKTVLSQDKLGLNWFNRSQRWATASNRQSAKDARKQPLTSKDAEQTQRALALQLGKGCWQRWACAQFAVRSLPEQAACL